MRDLTKRMANAVPGSPYFATVLASNSNLMSENSPLLDDSLIVEDTLTERRSRVRSVFAMVAGVLLFIGCCAGFIVLTQRARVPELEPLARVATLPLSAQLDRKHTDQRLIIIGDVHGMYKELKRLLHKVDYDKDLDRIVFLGDMITKGPDSLKVLDFAIDHNAFCVRGNHEDEIFSMYADRHRIEMPRTYPPFASAVTMTATPNGIPDTATATLDPTYGPTEFAVSQTTSPADSPVKVNDKERDAPLVKHLKKRHIRYLQACPAILKLGQVSKRGIEAVGVHGGLLWHEHELEKQAIVDVLRLRSILPPDYTKGSEDPDAGEPWFERWNEEQLTREKSERYEVFYGHDASKGLQLRRYSKGLDTRCQRGGELSAYVVRIDKKGKSHEKLVQIDCD